jgi:hypothetical protein
LRNSADTDGNRRWGRRVDRDDDDGGGSSGDVLRSAVGLAGSGRKVIVLSKLGRSASSGNSFADAQTLELVADAREVGWVACAIGETGKDNVLSALGETFDGISDGLGH